ncbi:hypothetical protein THII_3306 [Thioploca ingrica]|uniref:Uncharacterized protein n=1 Tax=Thioploca ingrica TaxID=40754 RepID=A0A090AH34_9GAMM|nr:hypothetical protein THII_3306 [Thioploca ingrica]
MSLNPTISISQITTTFEAGLSRITANVNGTLLWFESGDTLLHPVPEAFTSAFLLPAAHSQAQLTLDQPVSSTWLANASQILTLTHQWWNYSNQVPPLETTHSEAAGSPVNSTGLYFTGGVDSFYSLFYFNFPIHYLVFVQGYDVTINDKVRMAAIEQSLEQIVATLGIKKIVVRTNLRTHPAFRLVSWEQSHGGALVAIGYLLSHQLGKMVISSSYPQTVTMPWGTHHELDPLWSSERLQFIHFGDDKWRVDKLAKIADEPLVQQHLRVCWENRSPTGNCSQCEKCIRNMLVLAHLGKLAAYPVFDQSLPLRKRLDSKLLVSRHLLPAYTNLLRVGLPPDLAWSVKKLVWRSYWLSWPASVYRFMLTTIQRIF